MFAKTTLCQVFKNLPKTSISVIITFFKGSLASPLRSQKSTGLQLYLWKRSQKVIENYTYS